MQQPAPGVFYAGNGARFIAYVIDAFILGATSPSSSSCSP